MNKREEIYKRYDENIHTFLKTTYQLNIIHDFKLFIEEEDQGPWLKKCLYRH